IPPQPTELPTPSTSPLSASPLLKALEDRILDISDEITPAQACRHLINFLPYPDLKICQLVCLRIVNAAGLQVEGLEEWKELVGMPEFAELKGEEGRIAGVVGKRKREEGEDGRERRGR
ncbi:hypothetical protein HDV00_000782, partial [Rhizophlyctis rosea]